MISNYIETESNSTRIVSVCDYRRLSFKFLVECDKKVYMAEKNPVYKEYPVKEESVGKFDLAMVIGSVLPL